jgi:hypothetical protein
MKIPPLSRRWLVPSLVVALAALLLGAGAGAAFEAESVGSYWRGLWWAISLMTTVGFIGPPPNSLEGAIVSIILMISGFLLLSLLSAALASLFVREDEEPYERRERAADAEILGALGSILERIDDLERRLSSQPAADADPPPDPR